MQTASQTAGADPISHIIADTALALSHRPGEDQQRQRTRADATATMIRQLHPQNVIEAMLAGHIVVFHCLIDDAVQDLAARGEPTGQNKAASAGLVALNNAFHRNLESFRRQRKANAEPTSAAPRKVQADTNKAPVDVTPGTQTQGQTPPVPPAVTPPSRPIARLPGPPAQLTSGPRIEAVVDEPGTNPRSARPPNTAPAGVSHTAMAALATPPPSAPVSSPT